MSASGQGCKAELRLSAQNLRACWGARVCGFCCPIQNLYACMSFGREGLVGRGPMSATIAVLKCLRCVLIFWEASGACPPGQWPIGVQNVLLRGPLHDDRLVRPSACWLRAFDYDECDSIIPSARMRVCPCLGRDSRRRYAIPRRLCVQAGGPASAAFAAL
jgi:hypothetical protein